MIQEGGSFDLFFCDFLRLVGFALVFLLLLVSLVVDWG